MGLSIADLKLLTIGTVYDILDEKTLDRAFDENDENVYLINKSTFQESLDIFFPIND